MTVETALLIAGLLLLSAVLAARASERLRVPALLLFLAVGMLAGSEGVGGLTFDSPEAAQAVGTAALAVILFSGGLDTRWAAIRPVLAPGLLLATLGVALTALLLGTVAWILLGSFTSFEVGADGLSWPEGLLLGVIVASTDAAALMAMFRGSGPQPIRRIRSLLEVESGTNDPAAIILTTLLLGLLTATEAHSASDVVLEVVVQVVVGTMVGASLGWLGALTANRLRLGTPGLYPILVIAVGLITFGLADLVAGNPYLAVYLAGLVLGNAMRERRELVLDVIDAFAWLAQIIMFLVLGLLVFPSQLWPVAPVAVALALTLMVVARPIAVFACLLPFRVAAPTATYVSWAGLKGAVPIVLATFPATAGLAAADEIFNVVFFIVVVSVLVQGLTLGRAAERLGVLDPSNGNPS